MLRDVAEDDLPIFFEHQRDPIATRMAAFPSRSREAFMAHWHDEVLANPTGEVKTIVIDDEVVGNVLSWQQHDARLVGYWLGREHWGRGIATRALTEFLNEHETTRPLHAWVARDNVASLRVLDKCGFHPDPATPPHTNDDGIVELLMVLERPASGVPVANDRDGPPQDA
ncbi:GNAT family N-acetyltransferase [Paraliomyxa miuraensis]|uniref:GNAT family N-acetyltransferase n=1 Tax=Paraliomyxa miuraensis TaxID=376150 RepID=UPI002251AE61|nr:GNAT family N-acetyltransferase [Paraliomyxa miuraensis]MCX4247206.1 GNAT family N-acetyltransferase [Paraliomyxa miuraensis]